MAHVYLPIASHRRPCMAHLSFACLVLYVFVYLTKDYTKNFISRTWFQETAYSRL